MFTVCAGSIPAAAFLPQLTGNIFDFAGKKPVLQAFA
jgi:hypothetical protein